MLRPAMLRAIPRPVRKPMANIVAIVRMAVMVSNSKDRGRLTSQQSHRMLSR